MALLIISVLLLVMNVIQGIALLASDQPILSLIPLVISIFFVVLWPPARERAPGNR